MEFVMKQPVVNNVDEYISAFPANVQVILKEIRSQIKNLAPQAIESISYGMPAYKINKKPLVYFAGYNKHIGFYPTPVGIAAFQDDFVWYKTAKWSVQFPLDKPMPYDLMKKIIQYRLDNVE